METLKEIETEVKNVEHSLETKLHDVLHELDSKLQSLFGSHPQIATHIATAKAQVSELVAADTADTEKSVDPSNTGS